MQLVVTFALCSYLVLYFSLKLYSHIYTCGLDINACSKYGFGISISEGIIVYALNVMLLVKYVSKLVVMVSSWCDRGHQTCTSRSVPLMYMIEECDANIMDMILCD